MRCQQLSHYQREVKRRAELKYEVVKIFTEEKSDEDQGGNGPRESAKHEPEMTFSPDFSNI